MDVDRRSTKIPGPPLALKQLSASVIRFLSHCSSSVSRWRNLVSNNQMPTVQEANVARKRKAASPVKDGPDAKRQTPEEVANEAAAKAPQV